MKLARTRKETIVVLAAIATVSYIIPFIHIVSISGQSYENLVTPMNKQSFEHGSMATNVVTNDGVFAASEFNNVTANNS